MRLKSLVLSKTQSSAAQFLADGKTVAWFNGGSEIGPRALGHRSLLADPRDPNMKQRLNDDIKHREYWRPYAPSILADKAEDWFHFTVNNNEPTMSRFMLCGATVLEEKRELVPAITHEDGTTRPHCVTSEDDAAYYGLLLAFEKLTDVPILLNTSLNNSGEPIVETPAQALDLFQRLPIDYLVMGPFLIER
jgi:carbamoyltransferase